MNKYIYLFWIIYIILFILIIKKQLNCQNHIYLQKITTNVIINTQELDLVIPKKIYLCYKTKNIPSYIIDNWKKLNNDYEIQIYDNNDCIDFLKNNYTDEFVDIFNFIKDGPIKADFWRVCILYLYGGVYSDIDVKLIVPIKSFLEKDVSYLTCTSFNVNSSNPHFIVTCPKHPLLFLCIETYLQMYRNNYEYKYWSYSIVDIMAINIKKIFGRYINSEGIYYDFQNNKYQFISENYSNDPKDHYCSYNNKIILYNRYDTYDSDSHKFKNEE
jgi:hypothetical protein